MRRCLYLPALSAAKRNPVLKVFYDRLIARGKPANVAIVAVMRKLLIHMESVAASVLEKRQSKENSLCAM